MATFNPFDKPISDLSVDDLECLQYVSEGWYVDYKSEPQNARNIAKSLSAFANQYGGWLFIGITEDVSTRTAKSFPGLTVDQLEQVSTAVRNASKDLLSPEVYFTETRLMGPSNELALPKDCGVLVIEVPMGFESPYVHSDGRIYRRVGDSSEPVPETDRHILDRLFDRTAKAQDRISEFVTHSPEISQGERDVPFLHLSIMSDPHEIMGHGFSGDFHKFASTVSEGSPLPLDNVFPRAGGFIARQTRGNSPWQRVVTWDLSNELHSFVTLPMNTRTEDDLSSLSIYAQGSRCIELFTEQNISNLRVIDLNIIFDAVRSIMEVHRKLACLSSVYGPFYVKARLENIWRTVPFVDIGAFVNQIENYGIPVVQYREALAPPSTRLESFMVLDEWSHGVDGEPASVSDGLNADAAHLSVPIFKALGIPSFVLQEGVSELINAGKAYRRAMAAWRDV